MKCLFRSGAPLSPVTEGFEEQGERGGDLAPARIIEISARKRRTPILEHPLQATLGDLGLHQVLRHIGRAESSQCRIEHMIAVVEDQLAVNVDIQLAPPFSNSHAIQAAARGKAQTDATCASLITPYEFDHLVARPDAT